jgi:acetolactate synthase I/II/III large subunit
LNGAESVVDTLLGSDVTVCFANPGTSEMHVVAALARNPAMKYVPGLQENVVTGMADGYFRIARRPACTLLHCGPGLANGWANLHNARRARSGIVNVVGDHATHHRAFDAPLASDTASLARAVSAWVRTCATTRALGHDTAEAVAAARSAPGRIATLIVPSDLAWSDGGEVARPLAHAQARPVRSEAVDEAARHLRRTDRALILLGPDATSARHQALAWRIARATKASVRYEYVVGCVARGQGRMPFERVPYDTAAAVEALHPFRLILLVGAKAPVAFFAHPGKPSRLYADEAELLSLADADEDQEAALLALADALNAPAIALPPGDSPPGAASGKPTPASLGQTLAALLPEGAIVSDESISYGRDLYAHTRGAPAHDWLHLTGGAIGDGMPVAAGAALGAGRARRVVSLQADGSAMYSLQTLWTQAREKLPVTTILLNNRQYKILRHEYANVGARPDADIGDMLELSRPDLDWTRLANGMGVEAACASTMEQCADLLKQSFRQNAPFLIDLALE